MKYSALILGCGNIGALYDFKRNKNVWTHAKAFKQNGKFDLTLADVDIKKVKELSSYYNDAKIIKLPVTNFSGFNVVSIATPVDSHFNYLKLLLKQNIPVVICEKPIAKNEKELADLKRIYSQSTSKVIVNYIRRFQPIYAKLKSSIAGIMIDEEIAGINIKYQRGFLNNGSHAFDLLEYLFGKPFLFEKFHAVNVAYDVFADDPTISGICLFNKIPVNILGITSAASYKIFEIEIFFSKSKIVICNSGDEIRFYAIQKSTGELYEKTNKREVGILKTYMMPVINEAFQILEGRQSQDNFIPAAELNERMISVLKKAGKIS